LNHSIDAFLDNPSKITNARPISYQVDNISEGRAAAFTETANYNNTTCHAQAGHQETVGSIVKLTNLRIQAVRYNQTVCGDVLINGYPVAHIPDQDPYVKVREHGLQALPTQPAGPANSGWPQFDPPDTETYNLQGVQFPSDGIYLTDFVQRPTTTEFRIEGSLYNAIFPFRDDTANTYRATEISPFTTGSKTLQGNSAHCPLDLQYEIQKVANLVIDVP
jgi:hypothetical protein